MTAKGEHAPVAARPRRPVRALLVRLIDHAPLFPPASLPMAEALAEHRLARESAHGWLLGRFVCPASRLGELAAAYDGDRLPLAVVLDGAFGDGSPLEAPDGRLHVEAVESPLPSGGDPVALAGLAPEVYLELALDDALPERIRALAAAGLRAKVRCGGRAVPTVEQLAAFVRLCREQRVAFKATAGLHHALRTSAEYGFLNLLAAAVFGHEEEVLADGEPASFSLTAEHFRWRELEATVEALALARRELFVGYGSCSFDEPVGDLQALGILPA